MGSNPISDLKTDISEYELLAATVEIEPGHISNPKGSSKDIEVLIDRRLQELDVEIARYTADNHIKYYAYATACGIMSSFLNAVISRLREPGGFSNDETGSFCNVTSFLRQSEEHTLTEKGYPQDRTGIVENVFSFLNKYKELNIGMRILSRFDGWSERPTYMGLAASLITQFLRGGVIEKREKEKATVFVNLPKKDLAVIAVPAMITGIMNWLSVIARIGGGLSKDIKIPRNLSTLVEAVVNTPEIIGIAKCTDEWFGKIVANRNLLTDGDGVTKVFQSLLINISKLPEFKDSGLKETIHNLDFSKTDFRNKFLDGKALTQQGVPVILNEVLVHIGCMLFNLADKKKADKNLQGINWKYMIMSSNRTADRMLAVADMTFSFINAADTAFTAAMESGVDWVLFSEHFVKRFNYIGAYRASVTILKEFSNEQKEIQLIHEKMLLMGEKAEIMYQRLQEYKAELNRKLTEYLVQDITAFMEGFDDINNGLMNNDSDRVIRGNVIIQRVLGREPQFTNQKEFDELMDSDIALEF